MFWVFRSHTCFRWRCSCWSLVQRIKTTLQAFMWWNKWGNLYRNFHAVWLELVLAYRRYWHKFYVVANLMRDNRYSTSNQDQCALTITWPMDRMFCLSELRWFQKYNFLLAHKLWNAVDRYNIHRFSAENDSTYIISEASEQNDSKCSALSFLVNKRLTATVSPM